MGKCQLCQLFNTDHDTKSCPWLICKNCGKSGHAVKFCPKLKFKPLTEYVISKNSTHHLQKCHEVFKEPNSKIESDPDHSKKGKEKENFSLRILNPCLIFSSFCQRTTKRYYTKPRNLSKL